MHGCIAILSYYAAASLYCVCEGSVCWRHDSARGGCNAVYVWCSYGMQLQYAAMQAFFADGLCAKVWSSGKYFSQDSVGYHSYVVAGVTAVRRNIPLAGAT